MHGGMACRVTGTNFLRCEQLDLVLKNMTFLVLIQHGKIWQGMTSKAEREYGMSHVTILLQGHCTEITGSAVIMFLMGGHGSGQVGPPIWSHASRVTRAKTHLSWLFINWSCLGAEHEWKALQRWTWKWGRFGILFNRLVSPEGRQLALRTCLRPSSVPGIGNKSSGDWE